MNKSLCFLLLFFLLPVLVFAEDDKKPLSYTTHTQTAGPLTVRWAPQPVIDDELPHHAPVTFENKSDQAIVCKLRFTSIDTITPLDASNRVVASVDKEVTVPAKGVLNETFRFKLLPGTYTAHYPLHLNADFQWEGKNRRVHVIRVIETKRPAVNSVLATVTDIKRGGVSLFYKHYKASYNIEGVKPVDLGPNWTGSSKESHTVLNYANRTCGTPRLCLESHPPYRPKGGSLWLDFPVRLPQRQGLTLQYGVAIRTVEPPEPPSDGVTFRIWGTLPGEEKKLLDEIHTTSTVWVDRNADLSSLAGKKCTLTLEINPGPENNTACDGCFISGMTINSKIESKAVNTIDAGKVYRYPLACPDTEAVVTLGKYGLFDATYAFRNTKTGEQVIYNGLNLSVGSRSLDSILPFLSNSPELVYDESAQKLTETVSYLSDDQLEKITVSAYVEKGIFILDLPEGNPDRIGPLSMKPANIAADRVWFGHGYVVDKPTKSFRLSGGGHNLSTSHIGFDYRPSLSILMGTSIPPECISVDPQTKLSTLQFRGTGKLAILPDTQSAIHAAISYRTLCPWHPQPAAGVARKAGRLVFDVWGGRYANNTKELEKVFDWGVTDSCYIKHVWQRWGYDVRLPDIWGDDNDEFRVLPSLGTYDELRQLAQTCRKHDVPFGLHDNYIDFYPDANDFSYKYITFSENGQPRKAWINYGPEVQSYQWRPDLFQPFLLRNLEQAKRLLPEMDACFVDVFCSTNTFDFFTREGEFRSHTLTQKCWKKAFETIGEKLAYTDRQGKKQAGITVSEAGSDFLIGSIDSADAQWLQIAPEWRAWANRVPCENWARTPWFAAVNHTNFSRHGAGYADRYAGLRSMDLHGPLSDDYISAEILGGLDLMTTDHTLFPGSVRKHYLAQNVVRRLADKEITNVQFDKENSRDNIKRQTITWSDGTRVVVNRGESDWKIEQGIVLPFYGYAVFAHDGKLLSAIMRNPANRKEIVEVSQRDHSFYMNGRGFDLAKIYSITPSMASFKILENGRFSVKVNWQADEPVPGNVSTFVHVFEAYRGYGHTPKGWYAGGEMPSVPTSQWGSHGHTLISTGENQVLQVPEDMPDGKYQIVVGLFDKQHRFMLMGEADREKRYVVAEITLTRPNGKVKLNIEPVAMTEPRDLYLRLKANKTLFSWQGISTPGAVSVTPAKDQWQIVPIPVMKEFDVTLDQKIVGFTVSKIVRDQKEIPFKKEGDRIVFTVKSDSPAPYLIKGTN